MQHIGGWRIETVNNVLPDFKHNNEASTWFCAWPIKTIIEVTTAGKKKEKKNSAIFKT